MSRLVSALAAIVLLLLLSQAVLAQYESSGALTLAPQTVKAGGQVTASGGGFKAGSAIQLSTQQDATHLGTATADAQGNFSVTFTVPSTFIGSYDLLATGIDSSGSVRVLSGSLAVAAEQAQGVTSAPTQSTGNPSSDGGLGSEPWILALAGGAIVAMTGFFLILAGRRHS
jgi:hypothetical protein